MKARRFGKVTRAALVLRSEAIPTRTGLARRCDLYRMTDELNVLDLTNPAVRSQLGISLEQITSNDYLYTQALGDFARGRYSGLLVPSARQAGTSHLVILAGTSFLNEYDSDTKVRFIR